MPSEARSDVTQIPLIELNVSFKCDANKSENQVKECLSSI